MEFWKEEMLPNVTFALILQNVKKCILEDGFTDICSENFVIFAENFPWRSLLFRKLRYVELQFFWKKYSAKYIQDDCYSSNLDS